MGGLYILLLYLVQQGRQGYHPAQPPRLRSFLRRPSAHSATNLERGRETDTRRGNEKISFTYRGS